MPFIQKIVVLLLFTTPLPSCSAPPPALSGRWIEQKSERWEGATDDSFQSYVEEFEKRGPRNFSFQDELLTVSDKLDSTSRYSFDPTDEVVSMAFGNDAETTYQVVRIYDHDSALKTKMYIRWIGPDRISIIWPSTSKVLQEVSAGDNVTQIVEEVREQIELVKASS